MNIKHTQCVSAWYIIMAIDNLDLLGFMVSVEGFKLCYESILDRI